MQRATPVQIRQSLEVVETLKKAGIRFVPIPVLNEEDFQTLISDLQYRLVKIENFSQETKH